MNDRQLAGTFLIVVSIILFSSAAYNNYVYNTIGTTFPMVDYAPLLTIIGIVPLFIGIIFVAQARSKPWF